MEKRSYLMYGAQAQKKEPLSTSWRRVIFILLLSLLGEDRGSVLMSEREKGDTNRQRRDFLQREEGAGRERLTEEDAGGGRV